MKRTILALFAIILSHVSFSRETFPLIRVASVRGSGGGGVTEARAGEIATNTVNDKVASWAMRDQPDSKRDKSDLAVYSVTRTENTDWTWTSENKELEAALNAEGIKIKFHDDNIMWNAVADPSGWAFAPAPGTKSDLSVVMYFIKGPEWIDQYPATATRPRYMDETPGTPTNAVLAVVVTNGTDAVSTGDMVKIRADGRFVKATADKDYVKAENFSAESVSPLYAKWKDRFFAIGQEGRDFFTVDALTGKISSGYEWGFHWIENSSSGEPDLQDTLDVKADRATTLSGYGITDGATKTELTGKRDKADRAVYSVTRTENTDWTWTSENKELEAALNDAGTKVEYEVRSWFATGTPEGWQMYDPDISHGPESTSVTITFWPNGVPEEPPFIPATATRPRYMDETLGPAKQDQQIAAVATDDAAKPADGSLMKYDAANGRFVKAVEGTDYLKTHQDISGKRDKSDLAVYSVTRTENTDWTWTSENKELEEVLNDSGVKPIWYETGSGWSEVDPLPDGWGLVQGSTGSSHDAVNLICWFCKLSGDYVEYIATATRPRYMDETLGPAKSNQQLAAVATDNAAKPADGSLMKYDEDNDRFVKAVEGTDYLKTHQDISGKLDKSGGQMTGTLSGGDGFGWIMNRQGESLHDVLGTFPTYLDLDTKADRATTLSGYGITDGATKTELAGKRDLTNNVCRKTEFTEWICNPPRTEFGGVYSIRYDSPVKVYSLFDNEEVVEEIYSPTDDKLNLEFVGYCTATRSAVCTSNELFVTQSFVTNAVNAAKYVPNAADQTFSNAVLAVQIDTNTVAQIGELKEFFDDLPTGTAATSLGGIVLALLGAAAYLKKKTAHLESDGTATDDFATDLLGKQVAISAMKYGLASTSATVKAADRTVTKVTLGTTAVTVTFPDADENGKTRDFLLRIDAASLATGGSLTITKPTGATIYGDAFPSPEATKQYLVAITETASNEFYVRTIEIIIQTEA